MYNFDLPIKKSMKLFLNKKKYQTFAISLLLSYFHLQSSIGRSNSFEVVFKFPNHCAL